LKHLNRFSTAGTLLESVNGHKNGVSSLVITPDRRGAVSGGADKSIKFWEFDLISDKSHSSRYFGCICKVMFKAAFALNGFDDQKRTCVYENGFPTFKTQISCLQF